MQRVLRAKRTNLHEKYDYPVTPYSFRKGGDGRRSTHRELIVPSGSTGYIARYEIIGPREVLVLAVRHQLEDDYH